MKRFSSITTTQLARICGVSQGTVDRALHNRAGISPETREKILAIAREYEYVPHVKEGNQTRSMLIGVVLFDLYNEFFSKLAMSLVERAGADGYSVIFLFSNKDLKEEKSAIDYFNYIGVDGIVLFSVGSDRDEYKNYLQSIRRPIVAIGNRLFDFPYIGIDDYRAMYDLTCQMISSTKDGEIQYFAPILSKELHEKNAQRLRVEGFRRAMEEQCRQYRIVLDERNLSSDAAGIICSTDYYVFKALKRLDFSENMKFAGFDNVSMLETVGKRILTVEYPTDRISAECMNYFLRRKYQADITYSVLYRADHIK